MSRIGIYAGSFDPVHAGHVGFALQATQVAQLDEVYFLAERKPRTKPGAEHYGHRVAMLKRALEPHNSLGLIELVDKQLTVNRTLPQLTKAFSNAQIVLLMGSDVFSSLPDWSNVKQLTSKCHLMVSVRSQDELNIVTATIAQLRLPSSRITIMDSARPEVSSSRIRSALRQRNLQVQGLLPSVVRYAKHEWLYVQVPNTRNG